MEPDSSGEEWGIHQFDDPPHNVLLGPVFARGTSSGLIIQDGVERFRWGDIDRADMTFSVTKTYLALAAGVAKDKGLLPDLDEPVYQAVSQLGFDDEHNRQVTWRHLLQFTSEWQGSCFGVPDQIDHFRVLDFQPNMSDRRKGELRALQTPGSYWEYNDVRINQFSLALLTLIGCPVPDFFRTHIMSPIGASDTWSWHGYDNSWVDIDGQSMQSVPGGGHWGGGMVISAADQALIGQLLLNEGRHQGTQLVSEDWISSMLTPCELAPFYGFFTWLNTNHVISQSASEQSFFALGIGGQLIWHDPTKKLVCVIRWAEAGSFEKTIELINELLE